ncbi:MAG: recombinase family protein [Pyrinomonadaceae bacterium]
MPNKKYFSYVRVSTQRQGQLGTSLTEQKAAIERHAQKFNLSIVRYFEERETAAKLGRPVFLEMLKGLRRGNADGVIIHKIDRSARNLKDWADLGSLIDTGIEVHFASESLDLNSRGGRLSADIQAVVASDYIRNLREETKKGIYGRLKQGLYPFPAVIGYLNMGKGQPKKIDKLRVSLIRQAFELYSKGNIGLILLADEMFEHGLRNKNGKKVTINGLSTILHNPFYIGIIRIEKTGEMFVGKHKSIISKALFDQVQAVFEGKNIKKSEKHFFIFRRQANCAKCQNLYIAEKKKGHIYYRCHTRNCTKGTVREELIENEVIKTIKKLQLNDFEYHYFKQQTLKESQTSEAEFEANYRQLQLLQEQIKDRLSKLADAYVDGVFDKETYLQKKNKLILEEQSIKEKLTNLKQNSDQATKRLEAFLELVNSAYLSYQWGTPEEKRELVKTVFSNCQIKEKNVLVKPYLPFQMIAERQPFTAGSPQREAARTLGVLFKKLFTYFEKSDNSKSLDEFSKSIKSKNIRGNNDNLPTAANLT